MSIQTKTMTVKSDTSLAETTTTIRDTVTFDVSNMPNGITYKGLKAVLSFAEPIQWNKASTYDALTVVWDDASHGSYASKRPVPANIELTNEFYWLRTADLDAQVEIYRQEVHELDARVTAAVERVENVELKLDTKVYRFDTVADMQSASLKIGDVCITNGFHAIDDNGAAQYVITDDTPNGVDKIKCAGVTASLVAKDTIVPEMLGARCTSDSDDTLALQRCIDKYGYLVLTPEKTYTYGSTLNVSKRNCYIDGRGATLNYTGYETAINVDMSGTDSHKRDVSFIGNFTLVPKNAQYGIYSNYAIKTVFSDIKIYGIKHTGFYARGYETILDKIFISAYKVAGTVGFDGKYGDLDFGRLYGLNVETFMKGDFGDNNIEEIHAWCANLTNIDDEPQMSENAYNAWFANTVFINVGRTTSANTWPCNIHWCNCDTYNTFLNWDSYYINMTIDNLLLYGTNNLIRTNEETDTKDYAYQVKVDKCYSDKAMYDYYNGCPVLNNPSINLLNNKKFNKCEKLVNEGNTVYYPIDVYTELRLKKPTASALSVRGLFPIGINVSDSGTSIFNTFVNLNNNNTIIETNMPQSNDIILYGCFKPISYEYLFNHD